MKKLIVLLIVLLITLSGCSTGKKSNDRIYRILNRNSDWECSESLCSTVELNVLGDPDIVFGLESGYFYFKLFKNEDDDSWTFAAVYIYSEDKIELCDSTLIVCPRYSCTEDDYILYCDDDFVIDNYNTRILGVISLIKSDLD